MRFAAEMLRHKALGFTWNMPAFGEEVGMWRSHDKKLIKSANNLSSAFLNAELSEEVTILTQPAPELVQFGLVKPGTLYQCNKACYGLREAPKLWEESRDKTLTVFNFMIGGDTYSLRQSVYHPSLWFVVKALVLRVHKQSDYQMRVTYPT